ncbi:MAG TPA: hypothetical protein VE309_09940, partial [Caulobacteraceae bacterium]|nr:hypothetical protein [Caulobacteraceae bacterium]
MADNIVRLPRPVRARPPQAALGFFVRVGRDDHKELLELIASGEHGIFGFIVSAQNTGRHAALIAEARKRDFDVILDPKTQAMGLPGSYTDALAALPWGGPHHHAVSDFD